MRTPRGLRTTARPVAVAHAHEDLTPVTAHHGQQLLLAPDGAPVRVHQTPLHPWVRI